MTTYRIIDIADDEIIADIDSNATLRDALDAIHYHYDSPLGGWPVQPFYFRVEYDEEGNARTYCGGVEGGEEELDGFTADELRQSVSLGDMISTYKIIEQ